MAKSNNIVTATKDRISQLLDKQAGEIAEAKAKVFEADNQIAAAETTIEEATLSMDTESYIAATKTKERAMIEKEMYSKRLEQLEHSRVVTEEESDRTIDDLFAFEDEAEKEYLFKIRPVIQQLQEINVEYKGLIADCENVIRTWTAQIYPNYRSFTATYPDGTHRSPEPIPLRPHPYLGCGLSETVYHFLCKCDGEIEAE